MSMDGVYAKLIQAALVVALSRHDWFEEQHFNDFQIYICANQSFSSSIG